MNTDAWVTVFQQNVLPVLFRLAGAGLIWIIGRKCINIAVSLAGKALAHNKFDATLVRYLSSILGAGLSVFLALGVIDFLGIPTTSFAAMAAGAGLAIGAAWSGLLANFAAGIFLLVMRPFKVGDHVSAAGLNGVITEIGLFTTTIESSDNVQTLVGNGKLFGDNIANYSANTHRLCQVEFQVAHAKDWSAPMQQLQAKLNLLGQIEPNSAQVEFERFTQFGPVLVAEVRCTAHDYKAVRGEVAAAVQAVFGEMGFPGMLLRP